jgi:predicted ArsR family transcriptional regulator
MDRDADALTRVALLHDDLRRRVYEVVRRGGRAVRRDDVARELGISTNLAAFHLDKLTAAGLLNASYERPAGQPTTVGRAPKLYQPSDVQVEISIPPRRYDISGRVLLEALVTRRKDETPHAAAERVAHGHGIEMGLTARDEVGARRWGRERALLIAQSILGRYGYEPYAARTGEVRLRNCPFHGLAQESPEVVCTMNRGFIGGVVQGLGDGAIQVTLDPRPGECCVALRTSGGGA